MKQPNDFKYLMEIDGTEYDLPHAPTGWDESLINWTRNKEYFGIIRAFSLKMDFVLDGAYLLRKEFYKNGLASQAFLKIQLLDRRTWTYKTAFSGEFDFSSFADQLNTVQINLMEGGLSKMVKAFENVTFEIPLDDPDAIEILVPGIGVVERALFIALPSSFGYAADHFNGGILGLPGVDIISNDLLNGYVTAQSVIKETFFGQNQFATSPLWFAQANNPTHVRVNGSLKINMSFGGPGQTLFIQVRNNENEIVGEIGRVIQSGETTFEYDISGEMDPGERWFLITGVSGAVGPQAAIMDLIESDINLTNTLVTDPTVTKAFRPKTLFDRIIAKMNNGTAVETQSFFLTSPNWRRVVVTCGDAIRTLPDPVIKTSFRDFFDSFNALAGVGFGIENGVPVLEEKNYFMRDNLQIADVGEVKNFRLELATDFIYNAIKVGYPDNDYETAFGRDEYNSAQEYNTPITRVQRELNLVSVYRADQLGIEDLRLTPETENVERKDNSSDNDVFMIKIRDTSFLDVYFVEGAEAYRPGDGIKGVETRNSYYNLDLTPKKNLIRHGGFLRGMLINYPGQHIRFTSAAKNADLVTIDLEGNRVAEREWLPIAGLGDPLFLPFIATITTDAPKNLAELLTNFPNGFISFSYLGHVYKGFILEVSVDIAKNTEREFNILLSPSNNILNLVH